MERVYLVFGRMTDTIMSSGYIENLCDVCVRISTAIASCSEESFHD